MCVGILYKFKCLHTKEVVLALCEAPICTDPIGPTVNFKSICFLCTYKIELDNLKHVADQLYDEAMRAAMDQNTDLFEDDLVATSIKCGRKTQDRVLGMAREFWEDWLCGEGVEWGDEHENTLRALGGPEYPPWEDVPREGFFPTIFDGVLTL